MGEARVQYQRAAAKTARALGLARAPSGTFAFFDTRPFLRPGETPQQLLERIARVGVVLTPGGVSGGAYADWARLCFTSVPPSTLDRALDRLEQELRRV
jgi:hypothetical protein